MSAPSAPDGGSPLEDPFSRKLTPNESMWLPMVACICLTVTLSPEMSSRAADVEAVSSEVQARGAKVVAQAFDVADLAAVTGFVETVECR